MPAQHAGIRAFPLEVLVVDVQQKDVPIYGEWISPIGPKGDSVTARGALLRLLLLPKHLSVGLAIGIKAIMLTSFPSGFQFGPGDIQSGRHFLNTARKSCRSSSMVGRPKNQ